MAWCWDGASFQGVVDGQKRLNIGGLGVVGGGDEKLVTASQLLIGSVTKKPAGVGASAGFGCSLNHRKTAI